MIKGKKKLRKIIPAALLAAPLIFSNISRIQTDAAERKSVFNMKILILNQGNYESIYDINGNKSVDVYDIIRVKQSQYGVGSCGLEKPEITDGTPAVTSVSVSGTAASESSITETTSAVYTSDTSESGSVSVSEVSLSETQADTTTSYSEEVTALTTAVISSPDTTAAETTVSEAVTTAAAQETTSVTASATETTTSEAPVTTTVTTTEAPPVTTVTTTTTPAPVTTMPSKKIISNVKSMLQSPELPTGCEATGLTIAVRWYGYDVSKVDIAMKYMPRQDFQYSGSRLIGADFRTTFAGDPSRNDMSYGCYIPCMVQTVNNYFSSAGSSYRGKDISGRELEDLFPYIAQNIPVVIISTPELMTPRTGDSWYTTDGRLMTWQRGHHCMVLIGYDKINQRVYCADPMMRAGIVSWNISEFRNIYNLKGKNAMIIDTGSVTVPKKQVKPGEIIRFCGWANSSPDGTGNEVFLDTNLYTVTKIHENTSLPNPVCIGNIGWVSLEASYENIPYYGNGTPSAGDAPQNSAPFRNGSTYNIVSAYSGKYINVDYGIDKDGTNIYQWSNDNSTEQKFKLSGDENSLKIYAVCSSSGSNRMITASKSENEANVYLWSSVSSSTQEWIIRKAENSSAYYIALKASPDYVLTVSDSGNGSASGTGSTSAGNVYISKYSGSQNQLWHLFEK